ncbi:conjugal transfer protein TraF [Vibrio tritonius]|uniref:conjugal transfer protein TraF n=1 Tax=Vibrio tritonius TaxID=1435069 RepID=UPI000838A67C|nr:conjugal transfer protein TraF [Vibrio tritonius]
MKTNLKLITLSISFAAANAVAGPYTVEARGDAMGGVGVVSGTYLTAPFYNPALTAIYRRNDDAGMILPSVGISYDDQDSMLDTVDNITDILNGIDGSVTQATADELSGELDKLDGAQVNVELGAGFALGIPNQYLSMNLFGKAYAETFVTTEIGSCSDPSNANACTVERAQNSTVTAVSVGVTEVGLSMARYSTVFGQHTSFGISPKLQRIYTFVYQTTVDDFDLTDATKNSDAENVLNLDAGALWFYGPFRIGFSAMNLISHDIQTKSVSPAISGNSNVQYNYEMRPLYTVGAGIVADYFTLSVDYDLNEQRRYKEFADNTQMLRVGAELDLLRQLKLRVGYKKNVAYSNTEPTYTAGIGLSPLGLFEMDIAGSYTNENSMGAYVNFLATY